MDDEEFEEDSSSIQDTIYNNEENEQDYNLGMHQRIMKVKKNDYNQTYDVESEQANLTNSSNADRVYDVVEQPPSYPWRHGGLATLSAREY